MQGVDLGIGFKLHVAPPLEQFLILLVAPPPDLAACFSCELLELWRFENASASLQEVVSSGKRGARTTHVDPSLDPPLD